MKKKEMLVPVGKNILGANGYGNIVDWCRFDWHV